MINSLDGTLCRPILFHKNLGPGAVRGALPELIQTQLTHCGCGDKDEECRINFSQSGYCIRDIDIYYDSIGYLSYQFENP